MGLFAVIPLDDAAVQRLKNALNEIEGATQYNLDEVNDELMKRYNFVLFEGTPAGLSKEIIGRMGEDMPNYIVFDMKLVNIAGYGPGAFIQWIQHHGK